MQIKYQNTFKDYEINTRAPKEAKQGDSDYKEKDVVRNAVQSLAGGLVHGRVLAL